MKFKLHPQWESWSGHCQVTYVTQNEAGERLVYCLQDQGERWGGVRLMRCSQDGEPSHEVKPREGSTLVFERVLDDSKLGKAVNAWIEKHAEGPI